MRYHRQKEHETLHYRHWWEFWENSKYPLSITVEHLIGGDHTHLTVRNDEEDGGWCFSVALSMIFAVWITIAWKPISAKRYQELETGISVYNGMIWIMFRYDSDEGKGFCYTIDLEKIFLGRVVYSDDLKPFGWVEKEFVMPEGVYAAKYQLYQAKWTNTRWGNTRAESMMTIKIIDGVPIPGKGESAWDCSDYAVMETTVQMNGRSVEQCYSDIAFNIMKTRQNRAGLNWMPKNIGDTMKTAISNQKGGEQSEKASKKSSSKA